MSEITNQLIKPTDEQRFELAQREAKALTASTLVPKDYQNNPANCMIAIDISKRMGLSPIMVMQNLDIIHGRPSWRSQFIIGAINSCGRFGALKFRLSPENGGTCTAYATELATGGGGWTRAAAGDDLASVPNSDDSGAGPQKELAVQTKLCVCVDKV